MWFLWLNWRKSTLSRHCSECDVTMTDCSRVVVMDAFLAQWCWGQWTLLALISLFKYFVPPPPPVLKHGASLSPLKPRDLALLSWHVPYNCGSGNSVHQSFTWFMSLNWRKSTFYRSRVPILFQNLTADGLMWRHWHMGKPLAIVTSQWPIVPAGIYGRMMLRSTRVKGILGLTSLFTFLFIFGPPCFSTGHR